MNVSIKFYRLLAELQRSIDFAFLVKNFIVKIKKKVNWFNDEVRGIREQVRILSEMLYRSENPLLRKYRNNVWRHYRNKLKQVKKQKYEHTILNNGKSPTVYWNIINDNRPKYKHKPNPNSLTPDDLNDFFVNVADNIIRKLPLINNNNIDFKTFLGANASSNMPSFSLNQTSYIEVSDLINNLKNKHATGHYEIRVDLIKGAKYIVIIPLTKMKNKCIENSTCL